MIKLGQIFYGRGGNGYGILGASSYGRTFTDSVATLCRAVGSPDRPGDVRPFLLSKRERDNVVMIRACRGEDTSGRVTLFFHALVAREDELASLGLDAFAFAERDVFASSPPDGDIDDLSFSDSGSAKAKPCSMDVRFPAFIAADHPLDAEVRRTLGGETLSRSWTTYSYNSLRGFDLCVYSSYGASPTTGNRYVFEGGRFIAVTDSRLSSQSSQTSFREKNPLFMHKASLLLNAILVVVLAAVLVLRNGRETSSQDNIQPPEQSQKLILPPEMSRDEAFRKWGEEWEHSYRQKLRLSFEKRLGGNQHIVDFNREIVKIAPYYNKPGHAQDRQAICATLEAYVLFLEEIINQQQPQNTERQNHDNQIKQR